MSKQKICIIYTGGTIGMKRCSNGTLCPPDDPEDFLRVAPDLNNFVYFDLVKLLNKDSTNINHYDWKKIAIAIYERRNMGYDGFVVAHGTDTMHFSASAVAFALGKNLNFPVVFTGAQTIPEVTHGDARINLIRACKVATTDLAEVVISFGEFVFRGCRAQKKDERRFDAFHSPAYYPLAYITEEIIIQPSAFLRKKIDKDIEIDLEADFEDGVAQISLIPGLEPDLVKPILESKLCKGVILQSFGAGNVPHEIPYTFHGIIEEAKKHYKPVIITSQFPANATLHTSYEPGIAAVKAGAIPTGNMTNACAIAKFRWILAQVNRLINNNKKKESQRISIVKKMMQTIYVGEMDEA